MASTRTNEISADPKDPKTPLSVRLNSELCHKAESLYHELGISLSSAITVFLVGTISVWESSLSTFSNMYEISKN